MDKPSTVGFVSLVGAGPGDPGLMTFRGADRLMEADVVAYDRLANPQLLLLAPHAEHIAVGKQPDHHPLPQEGINALLVQKALEGKRVVRLKGGDPFVFGRGGEEAAALAEAGIPFEIIPGITSAISVPAYAGIPITHRGIADSAAFITGHRSTDIENPEEDWSQGSLGADTLVFLMGVKNLPQIVGQLIKSGREPDTPAALIERGTTAAQKTLVGTLNDIVEKGCLISPPTILVVGKVVEQHEKLSWFENSAQRPLFGLRILNTKSFSGSNGNNQIAEHYPWDEFDKKASASGAEVVHIPLIQTAPPADLNRFVQAVEDAVLEQKYTWVVFTSVNGVSAFFNQLGALKLDSRCLGGLKIAAIGTATAQALQSWGILPDFVPAQFTGEELGKALPVNSGDSVLLARSEFALPELPKKLILRGCIVDEVSTYSIKSAPSNRMVLQQLQNKDLDVVTLFSPSGVHALADMLLDAGQSDPLSEILARITVACIGPTTAREAGKLGIRVDIVAQEHTSQGLVEAIEKWRKH